MKRLLIRSFDGQYYYCSDEEDHYFAIEKDDMPPHIGIGDHITITEDGKLIKK